MQMEIPTYYSPEEFKKNYLIDYGQFENEFTLSYFLRECKRQCIKERELAGLIVENNGEKQRLSFADPTELTLTINFIEEFINKITSYNENEKGENTPYKITMLIELGIMKDLNIRYDNNKERLFSILQYITGCDKGLIKKYWLSKYGKDYKGKERISKKHLDDIRSKKLLE